MTVKPGDKLAASQGLRAIEMVEIKAPVSIFVYD